MNWIAERTAIREQARQLLRGLGEDADRVASALGTEGVRGKPHNPRGCAVAVYVGAVVAADPRVYSVSVDNARLHIRTRPRWARPIGVRLPPAVRQFIVAFDAGKFPALTMTGPARRSEGPMDLEPPACDSQAQ